MNMADLLIENAKLKNQIKDNLIIHVREMDKINRQLINEQAKSSSQGDDEITIKWLSTSITTPEEGREIVAKNPLKPIGYNSAVKQCRLLKFNKNFNEDMIKDVLLGDNLTLWSYTE